MDLKRVIVGIVAILSVVGIGWARQQSPAQKTPAATGKPRLSEEQKEKLLQHWRTKPEQTWSEFIADWLTPKPFSKKYVVRIDEKYAYPHIVAAIKMEIVREDDEFVWLRGIPPEDPESPLYLVWSQQQADEALLVDQREALNTPGAIYFLDFEAEAVPPAFQTSLSFEAHNEGLPSGGRWQMGFAVGDLNEDGKPDLVFPPRRKGYPVQPVVLLGGGDGGFSAWGTAVWPNSIRMDYGGVAVGDFDGDGHQDIVLAVHFGGQYVLYGNGKGDFSRAERLPAPDPRITSRAVTAADFDGDGRPDLAFVAEIDYDVKTNETINDGASVWVLYRRGESWKPVTQGFPHNQIADVIRSADVDGDGRLDLVVSSNSVGERRLVYLNQGGEGWRSAPFNGVLSSAYHYDVEAAGGEIFSTFVQFKMVDGKTTALNGIVAYPFAFREKGWMNGRPVVWDRERTEVFFRIALGDLNGDGLTDIVAGRKTGGLEVYLQGSNGDFIKETAAELTSGAIAYDLRVMDLDGDGLDDIVAGMVPGQDQSGGVSVWLTRAVGGEG
jgi:hypothetical protein